MMRIILNNKCKANINSLFYNRTYSFMYDVKTTKLGQFLDPKIFYVNNFQISTSVAIEVQFQSLNFKPKGANKVICGYFFIPTGLYCIKNIQIAQLLISKQK